MVLWLIAIPDYFLNMSHKLFFAIRDELFVNRPLLRMMPELTTMEHVHIDASMLVIYYCILHQGSVIPDTTERAGSRPTQDMMSRIYVGCLRAVTLWQREATGCLTDFVAAVLMVCPPKLALNFLRTSSC